jgi:hypothetical protein
MLDPLGRTPDPKSRCAASHFQPGGSHAFLRRCSPTHCPARPATSPNFNPVDYVHFSHAANSRLRYLDSRTLGGQNLRKSRRPRPERRHVRCRTSGAEGAHINWIEASAANCKSRRELPHRSLSAWAAVLSRPATSVVRDAPILKPLWSSRLSVYNSSGAGVAARKLSDRRGPPADRIAMLQAVV